MGSVDGNGDSRLMVTELSHITELVKQLDEHLGGCPDLCKRLSAQIFSVTERSIGMIMSGHLDGRKSSVDGAGLDSPPPLLSATPSPLSDVSDAPFKANKKRKMMEKRKHRIRVGSDRGAETPVGDGHSWRKYGQKEILGAKHPRAYYRCTHRDSQGCAATKQVQRADEDPTLLDVIYHGTHTCVHKAAAMAEEAETRPAKKNTNANSLLQSLSSSLTVKTDGLTAAEPQGWNAMPFCFSTPVSGLAPPEHNPFSTSSTPENCFGQGVPLSPSMELSPATSDSNNYPSMSPFQAEWRAQSELQEVVSALVAASSTPVPAIETDFSMDGFEFDPTFTIDVTSFFS